ncbi:major facilitator superfamily domain-containing protein [Pyronema omphalodes]|nr:major facilitator superfamily domain-containing protein [Pyronema omphalodes]
MRILNSHLAFNQTFITRPELLRQRIFGDHPKPPRQIMSTATEDQPRAQPALPADFLHFSSPLTLHRTNTVSTSCSRPQHHPHHLPLLRRIDLRLVPILSTLYLLCFLCRQNIGNAKTYHLAQDLNLSHTDYQWALTVFFFTYSLFDVPANMLLRLLHPHIWLPSVTLASGIVTVGMGMANNAGGLIAARLILGMTECGLFPGVAYVITLWYRKREAQFRQALFFCAASMSGAFAGALAVGISKMDGVGGLEGWRWILIVEGLITVVVSTASFWLVLDIPARTTFLDEEEKELLLHRLTIDEFGEESDESSQEEWEHMQSLVPSTKDIFRKVLTDHHLFLHIFIFWGISCPLYSISLCLPTIVVEMGYTKSQANFLTVPIYITACILSMIVAFYSDRMGLRTPFLAAAYGIMIIGFVIAAAVPKAAYAGVFIAACGVYPAFPGMITWASNNLASSKKRAMAMALHIGCGSLGGAMGANFYRDRDAPRYLKGHMLNLGFVVVGAVAMAVNYVGYIRQNKKREAECARRNEELEKELEKAGKDEVAGMRKQFLLSKKEDLTINGDRSVWFRYCL